MHTLIARDPATRQLFVRIRQMVASPTRTPGAAPTPKVPVPLTTRDDREMVALILDLRDRAAADPAFQADTLATLDAYLD